MTQSLFDISKIKDRQVATELDAAGNKISTGSTASQIWVKGTTSGKFLKWNVSDSLLDVRGQTKLIYRPTTADFGVQIKTESTGTTNEHRATDVTADWTANGTTAGACIAVGALSRVDATYTLGAGAVIAVEARTQNSGTVNSSSATLSAFRGTILDGGTYTAVNHVSVGWLNSDLAQTISAGRFTMLRMSIIGSTTMNELIYVEGSTKVTNFVAFDGTTGMAVDAGTPATNAGYIKCAVGGATRYIALYSSPT